MDVGFVHMGADDKGVFPFGEAAGQLIAQAVGLLRGDLAGDEGLPDGIGNHIIGPAPPAGLRVCSHKQRYAIIREWN